MVNFTLVFFKGNKTVDELHQVLEKSVENGSVYSLPVQRGMKLNESGADGQA